MRYPFPFPAPVPVSGSRPSRDLKTGLHVTVKKGLPRTVKGCGLVQTLLHRAVHGKPVFIFVLAVRHRQKSYGIIAV
jgi:hypothetical protein